MDETPKQTPIEAFLEAMNTLPLAFQGGIAQTSYLKIVDRSTHVWSKRCENVISGLELYLVNALVHAPAYIRYQREHFSSATLLMHMQWKKQILEHMLPLYNLMGLHAREIPSLGFTTPPYAEWEIAHEADRLLQGHDVRADWPYVSEPHVQMLRKLMERMMVLLDELVALQPFLPEKEAIGKALHDLYEAGMIHHIHDFEALLYFMNDKLLSTPLSKGKLLEIIENQQFPAHIRPASYTSLHKLKDKENLSERFGTLFCAFEIYFRKYRG